MELRVVVITVISLIIVSMSLFVQGQRQLNPIRSETEVNLLEQPAPGIPSAGNRPSANPFGERGQSHSWNPDVSTDEGDEAFDRYESNPIQSFEFDSAGESELLEPDSSLNRSVPLPTESFPISPEPNAPVLWASSGGDPATSDAEVKLVPEAGSAPLETVWQSEVSNQFANSATPPQSGASDSEWADEDHATADRGVILDPAAAPAAALANEITQESPANSPTSTEQQTLQDVPQSVAQIARNHLQYGNSLARRGSLFSARQEFFSGLRLIIESLDLVNGVSTHREHYGLAIMALNEAEDFVAMAGDDVSQSVPRIVELHQSKVLSPSEIQSLTSMAAMQAYFAFAQEHFSAACAHSPIASELLFSLGKLHTVKATQDPSGQPTDLAIAILMHQAALNVDPSNFLSANELGVALAKLGYYEPARAALLHSVATQPTPEAWLNLSIVHRALGETRLADLALTEKKAADALRGRDSVAAHPIRWLAPNEFSAAQQVHYEETESRSNNPADAATTERKNPSPANEGGIWATFKRSFGTQ